MAVIVKNLNQAQKRGAVMALKRFIGKLGYRWCPYDGVKLEPAGYYAEKAFCPKRHYHETNT